MRWGHLISRKSKLKKTAHCEYSLQYVAAKEGGMRVWGVGGEGRRWEMERNSVMKDRRIQGKDSRRKWSYL